MRNHTDPRRSKPALVLFALVAILTAFVAGGPGARGAAAAFMYEQTMSVDRWVTDLRCTDVDLGSVRIEWSYTPLGTVAPIYYVERNGLSLGTTTNKYLVDNFAWTSGTQYTYTVWVQSDSAPTMGLPAPPANPPAGSVYFRQVASGQPPKSIHVTPVSLVTDGNQTADSRYDLRYGNPTYLDFPFGGRTYHGGLFVGYAADPSRVGRSYLHFTLPSVPSGNYLWAANLTAYYLRSASAGTTTVGCHVISPAWTAATLKWSTAPSVTPGSPLATATVTWDPDHPETSAGWKRWNVSDAAGPNFYSGGLFAAALASTNEAASGWAYFIKQEYDATKAPRLVYAYGDPMELLSVAATPATVTSGSTSTGKVTLTAAAPSGGVSVSLASSASHVTVPASVTVPAGSHTGTFTISTTSGMTGGSTLSATYAGETQQTSVTVN
jgi:hypothetical protein